MLFIRVVRKKASYNYKRFPNKPDAWDNNDHNNCLDDFILFDYESRLISMKCQTVSNIPGGRFLDTIAPGPFLLRCFVDQRMFYPRIHGICQTSDLENQWIADDCTEDNDKNRWLVHDDQKLKPNPPSIITRACWSAGCFVSHKNDIEAFNSILDAYGIKKGDTIDGELLMEA